MTATTLAHFSDPHLAYHPDLTPAQRFSKRQLSALSWARGRRQLQQHDLLDRLVADVRAAAPQHWAITGDVVNFSLPGEFPAAAEWLRSLAPPDCVSVVPGNHDALVTVPAAQGWDLWRPWMSSDDGSAGWPYVRVRGGVALVGLSTALPTPPSRASGWVGAPQLQRLSGLLAGLGARRLCRVLLLHHPPVAGVVSRRKALVDAAALRQVLAEHGVELVLHGHARDARLDSLRGPVGAIPCLGLPSASATPSAKDAGARWQLLRLEPAGEAWRLTQQVRIWNPATADFAAAGTFRFDLSRQRAG